MDHEGRIEEYLDAFRELLLPQASLLVGNHSTLARWLLPDWSAERSPTARDIARAANEYGVPYTLVTGIPLPDQFIDNVLASPKGAITGEKFERFEAGFVGAGDTLSAAIAALLASGEELHMATSEALSFLDQALDSGFRPGMGNVIPDRFFWALPAPEEGDEDAGADALADTPPNPRNVH